MKSNRQRVQATPGVNAEAMPAKSAVSFVLIGNAHPAEHGIRRPDCADIVIAPVFAGGKNTSSLIGGASVMAMKESEPFGVMKLPGCGLIEDSCVRVRYEIPGSR